MSGGMGDLSYSMQMRDVIRRLVKEAVDQFRPRPRYAVVQLIDRPNRKCSVLYNGDVEPVVVNMGSIQPKEIGQVVRIEGVGTDKYIADVMGDNNLTGTITTEPAPTAATYKHTQVSAAASWTITHNLNKYPMVAINIAGKLVYADVDYPSLNQVTITFPVATTGIAHLV